MFQIGQYKINNPYILAPMAGVSQMPFRKLALKFGAGLAPTELISAKGLFYQNIRTQSYLKYDAQLEYPFWVQLFGGDPESMSRGAQKAVELGAQILDINMGCPVKKVTKTNSGSALMCDYKRAAKIIIQMRQAVGEKVPITAKIRSGWDQNLVNFLEVALVLEDAGIAAISIHPRTRAQGYSGKANWDHIAQLKQKLQIPVIGNGDIKSKACVQKIFKQTNCDAVMIGRAALGNPWIFRELTQDKLVNNNNQEKLDAILSHFEDHLDLNIKISQKEKNFNKIKTNIRATRNFRSHVIWYSRGFQKGSRFRDQVMRIEDPSELKDLILNFFSSSVSSEQLKLENTDINYKQAFG